MKVFFIYNSYTWYREPFFLELSNICDIKFFFTKLWKNGYKEIKFDQCKIGKLDYEIIPNKFHVAWPIFTHLLKDEYDVVMVTVMDNWHQTLEAFLSAIIAKFRKKKVVYFWIKWDEGWLKCEKRNLKQHKISFLRYIWRLGRIYKKRMEVRIFKNLVDEFIAVGKYSKEYFLQCGVKKEKITIVHDASQIFYQSIATRKKVNFSENKIIVLFMARVIKLKGLDQLLEAFSTVEKKYKNVELIICGDGEYLNCVKENANKFKLKNIKFAGSIEPDRRKDYYANCDIFVLPNWEPDMWGMAVNEAMQFGKPIIISDLTGCGPELVKQGENGYIIESGNVKELEGALSLLISDEKTRIKAGKLSKEIISDYSYKQMALDFNYVFQKTLI